MTNAATKAANNITAETVNYHLSEVIALIHRPQDFMRDEELDKGCTHSDVALRAIAHSLYAIGTLLEHHLLD